SSLLDWSSSLVVSNSSTVDCSSSLVVSSSSLVDCSSSDAVSSSCFDRASSRYRRLEPVTSMNVTPAPSSVASLSSNGTTSTSKYWASPLPLRRSTSQASTGRL